MIGDDYAYQLKEMPGIDERLSRIIAKMIAREEERYGSIKEVIQDMTAYLTSVRKLPELPELLTQSQEEKTIRFSYRIGDVKYSPYTVSYTHLAMEDKLLFDDMNRNKKNVSFKKSAAEYMETGIPDWKQAEFQEIPALSIEKNYVPDALDMEKFEDYCYVRRPSRFTRCV